MKINIPYEFLELCANWHSGQDTMFYAVSSTGSLSLGTIRPTDCPTDKDWMLSLLNSLESEVRWCIRVIKNGKSDLTDLDDMERFLKFVESEVDKLEKAIYTEALSNIYNSQA